MDDIECPYCGEEQEICHDDGYGYEEDTCHEMECFSCEKTFVFTTVISFDYYPAKADCLNGEPHKLKESRTHPRCRTRLLCEDCDYSEALPADHPYLKDNNHE